MRFRKSVLIILLLSMLVGCGGEWSSGDRVLVSKLAYDSGFTLPHRYDVVVFKYPRGPVENNTPKNYIKRLLGLPGELIAIFFGRLYRWSPEPGDLPPFDDHEQKSTDLFAKNFLHFDENPGRHWFEQGHDEKSGKERRFEILRKPPKVMLAMRRIVFDNDYQARDLKGKLDRWSAGGSKGWKADRETRFVSDGKTTDQVDWLRYRHLVRPREGPIVAGEQRSLITDAMDYNSFQTTSREGQFVQDKTPSPNWVGDLMIECNVEVLEPRGEIWLELSKGINRFQARWDLASGQCSLVRISDEGKKVEELAVQSTRVKTAGNYRLRFANIDAQLTVWIDRDLPFGEGKEYDPPELRSAKEKDWTWEKVQARCGPTENDLQPASVGSKGARVEISHLQVWRDSYYTTFSNRDFDVPGEPDREFWSDPNRWGPLRKQHFVTMFVQPGHYLCLGDNSQASSDSRDWGLVPDRLMLGRALTVYFPHDRMGPIR